ncbi:hypothetical protein pb186bvf_020981 [Paramecium bursaria]
MISLYIPYKLFENQKFSKLSSNFQIINRMSFVILFSFRRDTLQKPQINQINKVKRFIALYIFINKLINKSCSLKQIYKTKMSILINKYG